MVSPQMRPCHKPTAGHSDRSKYNLQQNRFFFFKYALLIVSYSVSCVSQLLYCVAQVVSSCPPRVGAGAYEQVVIKR